MPVNPYKIYLLKWHPGLIEPTFPTSSFKNYNFHTPALVTREFFLGNSSVIFTILINHLSPITTENPLIMAGVGLIQRIVDFTYQKIIKPVNITVALIA